MDASGGRLKPAEEASQASAAGPPRTGEAPDSSAKPQPAEGTPDPSAKFQEAVDASEPKRTEEVPGGPKPEPKEVADAQPKP